jgi:hypothetical protein
MLIDRSSPVSALTLLFSTVGLGLAQETVTYAHPGQPMSIEAPIDWTARTWPSDPGVYEVAAPDGSVRALLWFTQNEQGAAGYLNKMVDMKPVQPTGEPFQTMIGEREVWQVVATGSELGDENVTETFAVIHVWASPMGEGNYVLQIWCPTRRATELGPLAEDIVNSLRVGDSAS